MDFQHQVKLKPTLSRMPSIFLYQKTLGQCEVTPVPQNEMEF